MAGVFTALAIREMVRNRVEEIGEYNVSACVSAYIHEYGLRHPDSVNGEDFRMTIEPYRKS